MAFKPPREVISVVESGSLRSSGDREAAHEGSAGFLQADGIALLLEGESGGFLEFAVQVVGLVAGLHGQVGDGHVVVGLICEEG